MLESPAKPGSQKAAFAAVTVLFFAWGFITSLVDPLVAAVKGIFTLTDFQAQASASRSSSPISWSRFPPPSWSAALRRCRRSLPRLSR